MKPETLYDACAQAAEAIEMQPLNYHQGHWSFPVKDAIERWKQDSEFPSETIARAKEACGTLYCRAGHIMCAVKDGPVDAFMAEVGATKLLKQAGVPEEVISALFNGTAVGDSRKRYGTSEYAKDGADGLRKLMAAYEPQLKSVRIE